MKISVKNIVRAYRIKQIEKELLEIIEELKERTIYLESEKKEQESHFPNRDKQ